MAMFGDAGREAHDDLTERVLLVLERARFSGGVLRGPWSTRQRLLLMFGRRWVVAPMSGMPLPWRVRRRFTRLVGAGVEFDRMALGLEAPEPGIGVDLPPPGRRRHLAAGVLGIRTPLGDGDEAAWFRVEEWFA